MITLLLLALAAGGRDVEVLNIDARHPRVVLYPQRGAPTAAVRVVFDSGAADDGDAPGRTRLAQLAMLRAQRAALSLDDAVWAAGGTLALFTEGRRCGFELTAARGAFDKLAPQLLRLVLQPQLEPARFEAARERALTDLIEPGSDVDVDAWLDGQLLAREGADTARSDDNPVWGERESLRRVTRPDVESHIRARLTPANATVVAAGGFDAVALKRTLKGLWGGSGKRRTVVPVDVQRFLPLRFERAAPRQLRLHLQLLDVTDEQSAALAWVLTALAHDRLLPALRGAGGAGLDVRPRFGAAISTLRVRYLAAAGAPAEAEPALAVARALAALRASGLDEEDLSLARTAAAARLLALEEDALGLVRVLEPAADGVVAAGPGVLAAVAMVDAQSLAAAAARALADDHSVQAVFGPGRGAAGGR